MKKIEFLLPSQRGFGFNEGDEVEIISVHKWSLGTDVKCRLSNGQEIFLLECQLV